MAESGKTIEDRVRERAYALWEMDGRPDGRSDEYWHRALSDVQAEEAGNGRPDDATERHQPPSVASKAPQV